MRVVLPRVRFKPPQRMEFLERALRELRALPGVSAAAVTDTLPTEVRENNIQIRTRETLSAPLTELAAGSFVSASGSVFETMRIPLLAGRVYGDQEKDRVVITAAGRALFGNRDPLGQEIRHGMNNKPLEVVGVVGDIHPLGLDQPAFPVVFMSLPTMVQPASAMQPALRQTLAKLDPMLGAASLVTLDPNGSPEVRHRRQQAVLIAWFGLIALVVASAGVYGVIVFALAQRRKELAIRLALGAAERDVRELVWREAMLPVGVGATAGLATALR